MIDEKTKALIRLVHFLSYGRVVMDYSGNKWHEQGLNSSEIIKFLESPLREREGMTVMECIELQGDTFVNDVISFLNKREQL